MGAFCMTLAATARIELPPTAAEMVEMIATGIVTDAHMRDGDFVRRTAYNKHRIGACFLEKVNMIAEHEMMTHEPTDLAIDLAACCADEHDRKILDMCPYLDSTGLCELFDQGPEHEDKRITHENPHINHLDNDENSRSSVAFTVISIGMLLALCS